MTSRDGPGTSSDIGQKKTTDAGDWMSKRDDFTAATRVALAKRSGYRCAFQPCGAFTEGPSEESPKATSSVGVACHITAAAIGGPRYDETITSEQRKSIENGIWMCQTHAKHIDDDEKTYTKEVLRRWKREAEAFAARWIGVPTESEERSTTGEERLECMELELNRLVAHRIRDALTTMRFPMIIFLNNNATNSQSECFHRLLIN